MAPEGSIFMLRDETRMDVIKVQHCTHPARCSCPCPYPTQLACAPEAYQM